MRSWASSMPSLSCQQCFAELQLLVLLLVLLLLLLLLLVLSLLLLLLLLLQDSCNSEETHANHNKQLVVQEFSIICQTLAQLKSECTSRHSHGCRM